MVAVRDARIDVRDASRSEALSHLRRLRVRLEDGGETTVHVASYPRAETRVRVALLPPATTLVSWCDRRGVGDAIVGGFFLRRPLEPAAPELFGMPLGALRIDGVAQRTVAFDAPWDARRACVHVDGEIAIARRDQLPDGGAGDLLQAGPLLVHDRRAVDHADEGFAEGAGQFDQDITVGRHPRAALALDDRSVLAVACDGRAADEAGLSLAELAQTLIALGARTALNLDGGGSTSLVCGRRLRNAPRDAEGRAIAGGRAIPTALYFERR
ncbi:MAG TPA: phosphodiester glycosidase family protein [Solirubrobacteraceae bacterium]|nr:phosphodiester glycosidase family protein [Solirubrobacteraceae bacterium]